MAIPGGPIRMDGDDLADFDSHDFRGFLGRCLALWLSLASPNDKGASDPQERRGVLDHNLKRSQSPCGHEVHRCRPLLDSGMNNVDIADLARSDGAVQELALAL
jgi:hypothetical protein